MVYPNVLASAFCNWMLYVSWQKLTTPQRQIVQTVYLASLGGTSVTAQEWRNFNVFTAWRYPYFRVWFDLQTISMPTAWNPVISSWVATLLGASVHSPSLLKLINLSNAFDYADSKAITPELDHCTLFLQELQAQALTPFINTSNVNPSNPAGLSWAPGTGFTGDGANILPTGWNPTLHAVKYTQDSACIAISFQNGGPTNYSIGAAQRIGGDIAVGTYTQQGGNATSYTVNSNLFDVQGGYVNSGRIQLRRTGATASEYIADGAQLFSNAYASFGLPNREVGLLAFNVNAPYFYSTAYVRSFIASSGAYTASEMDTFIAMLEAS